MTRFLVPIGVLFCSVSYVFPYGAIEIRDLEGGAKLMVNGQRLKQFLELLITEDVECLILWESSSEE